MKLAQMLEAARWAASCYNDQPWRFIVVTSDYSEAYAKLLDCLVPFNQGWAATAPVLMLAVAHLNFEHNNEPNRHAYYDLGQAVATLLVQATAVGVHAHQMAGFDPVKARAAFNIPPSYDAVAAIAVGYLGDPSRLPKELEEKDPATRQRHELETFAFCNEWGRPFSVG